MEDFISFKLFDYIVTFYLFLAGQIISLQELLSTFLISCKLIIYTRIYIYIYNIHSIQCTCTSTVYTPKIKFCKVLHSYFGVLVLRIAHIIRVSHQCHTETLKFLTTSPVHSVHFASIVFGWLNSEQEKVTVRVARIFNTFGPRMHMEDGRVVSNFILQALRSQPIIVFSPYSLSVRTILCANMHNCTYFV